MARNKTIFYGVWHIRGSVVTIDEIIPARQVGWYSENVKRHVKGIIRSAVDKGIIVNRSQVLDLLSQNKPALADRFGLVNLALFGSTARDAAGPDSDIDILVSFSGPATSERYFGVQFFLEDLLGRPIDLVTEKALRPEMRPFIELEAVHV